MKSKFVASYLAALALLLLGGWLYWQTPWTSLRTGMQPDWMPSGKPGEFETAVATAVMSGDPSKCEISAKDDREREECKSAVWESEAVKAWNPKLCARTGSPERRARCADATNLGIAESRTDPAACGKIRSEETKRECLESVVVRMVDSAGYEPAPTDPAGVCRPLGWQAKSYCEWRTSNDADVDAMRSAVTLRNPKACATVGNGPIRSVCETLAKGAESGDCSSVEDPILRTQCVMVARVAEAIESAEQTPPTIPMPEIPMAVFRQSSGTGQITR